MLELEHEASCRGQGLELGVELGPPRHRGLHSFMFICQLFRDAVRYSTTQYDTYEKESVVTRTHTHTHLAKALPDRVELLPRSPAL